jgi:asparagine synthase (glutamine-hydrolysing)
MCGIAGIYGMRAKVHPKEIKKMTDSLWHRGPDDEGFLGVNFKEKSIYPLTGKESKVEGDRIEDFDKSVDLFLGHRRLSIIDLSDAGHQPMCNENGRIWVVYNGEIYNYREVRTELELLGHRFKSHTDTEVIVHGYEEWQTDCVKRFNGMWAFALIDLDENKIFCSRDRIGVKPFYYTYDGDQFCFASEIKAFLEMNDFAAKPNEQILADYLFFGLLDHTEETFLKNIYQLKPGTHLMIEGNQLKIKEYWDIEPGELHLSEDDYTEQFYELFKDSIRLRLRTDVPIGTCLSGGLDSSAIVCLTNQLMLEDQIADRSVIGDKQKTFSSCFEDHAYDERQFIELVIGQTGAERNYFFPSGQNLVEVLPKLLWHQDEPFGSTGIYAQWELMKLAKERRITVLLDGQGGDELLGGYLPSFYYLFRGLLKDFSLRHLLREMRGFQKYHAATLFGTLSRWITSGAWNVVNKRIEWANETFQKRFHRSFSRPPKFENDLNNYLYQSFRFLTLPRFLHYEDRNSMAFSNEARLPFLDFRLVEYIFALPPDQKIREGVTKFILRKAMKGVLPEGVRERYDKMGFVTPDDLWFRTVLKDRILKVLNSKTFADRGYFVVDKVKDIFQDCYRGKKNMALTLWRCVNTELWFRTFVDRERWSEGWKLDGKL